MNSLFQGQLMKIMAGMFGSLLAMFVGCLPTGCAMFTPGASVERGVTQSTLKEWRADGSFWAEAKGTHEEVYTMAQGHLVMKEGEDGEPTIDWENSVIEYYLTAKPSAKVAGTAMEQAFVASTAQMGMLSSTINELVSAMVPLLSPIPDVTVPK